MKVRRIRKEKVVRHSVESVPELVEYLRDVTPAADKGHVIVFTDGGRERRFVYAGPHFRSLWRLAAKRQFAPWEVERLFLTLEAEPVEPGVRPDAPAFVTGSGDVWVGIGARSAGEAAHPTASVPEAAESAMAVPPAEPLAVEELRRTPHLELPEAPLQAGQVFALEVFCDCSPPSEGEEVKEVSLSMPAGWKRADLEVWLALPPQLESTVRLGNITVTKGEEESTRARFEVVVAEDAEPAPIQISAVFSFQGRPCGQVTRMTAIGSPAGGPSRKQPPVPRIAARPGEAADLTIEIKAVDDSEQEFECRLSTALHKRTSLAPSKWHLPSRAPAMVEGFMEGFTEEGLSDGERISRLRGAGLKLWRAAPPQLQDLYWALVDEGNPPQSILVVTDEWSFPWELAVPVRGQGPAAERRQPLGLECDLGRWVDPKMVSPPQALEIKDSYVLAPSYGGDADLPDASEEARYVCDNLNGTAIEPAAFESIEKYFSADPVSLFHCACHGKVDGGVQSLKLEAGKSLRSDQIEGIDPLVEAFGAEPAFVFVNSCEAGRSLPALVGVGGFATEFIGVGAGGVIAPLWSVEDGVAHRFAEEVYDDLRAAGGGAPAAVVRKLRMRAYEAEGADSWAAYSFYGDPLMQVNVK